MEWLTLSLGLLELTRDHQKRSFLQPQRRSGFSEPIAHWPRDVRSRLYTQGGYGTPNTLVISPNVRVREPRWPREALNIGQE